MSDRLKTDWPGLLAVLLALAVFASVCGHEFLSWDDATYVAGNPALANPTLASLASIWKHPEPGLYIPLPYTLWWGIAQVAQVRESGAWALNPQLFHAANWLLHGLFVWLVYRLLRRLNLSPRPAGIGAAIMAVHPLAVETVAWTMGLRDELAAIFAVGTLLLTTRRRYGTAAGVMLLAVLSKPTAIMVWPMAIAVGAFLAGELRPALKRSWPLAIVAGVGVLLTQLGDQSIHPDVSRLWQRPLIATDALAFYLVKAVAPYPLAFDYARSPAAIFASGQAWWTWLLPAAVTGMLFWVRSRFAWLAAGLFALPLLPVLGLIPFSFESLSTVADHYAYLSLLGVALAVGGACQQWGKPAAVVAGGMIVCFTTLSVRQTAGWADNLTFFTFMTRQNPRSGPAWDGLARTRLAAGDLPAADDAAARAIAANPDYALARLTAAQIKFRRGDRPAAEAQLDELERIYARQKNFDPALFAGVRAKLER